MTDSLSAAARRIRTGLGPPRRQAALAAAIAALGLGLLIATTRSTPPVEDETQYLALAYNLFHRGVLSMAPPEAEPTPDAYREPGYPVFLAALMAVDSTLRTFDWTGLRNADPTHAHDFDQARYANSVFIVLSALIVFRIGWIAGGPAVAWIAFLLLLANPEAHEMRYGVVSDYLALLLVAAATLLAIEALRHRSLALAFAAGGVCAALTLTKAAFLYLFAPLALAGLLWAAVRPGKIRRRAMRGALVFALAFALPVGAWMARNAAAVGAPVVTVGRGALALSERVALNRMTLGEYPVAFLWWTRDFGDNLARRYLPSALYGRFEEGKPGSFYPAGHIEGRRRIARAMEERGLSFAAAAAQVTRERLGEILADLPWHLAVSLPVLYRGVWIDQFVWIGFPALIWLTGRAVRGRDAILLVVILPAVFTLLFHALATSNYPRYGLPALPGFAVAAAMAMQALAARIAARRGGGRSPGTCAPPIDRGSRPSEAADDDGETARPDVS